MISGGKEQEQHISAGKMEIEFLLVDLVLCRLSS